MPICYREAYLPDKAVDIEHRDDGSLIITSTLPLNDADKHVISPVMEWAAIRPSANAFAQADGRGGWQFLTWKELENSVLSIGAKLLREGFGVERPIVTACENSIPLARLLCAAQYVGVPVAVLPSTSIRGDAARARSVVRQIGAGALFLDDAPVSTVLEDLGHELWSQATLGSPDPATADDVIVVAKAHRELDRGACAKIMFTSGSSGPPKGVILTHAMLSAARSSSLPLSAKKPFEKPVYVDWMPWSHAMAGNITFHRSLHSGGTYYIDDGKPAPATMHLFGAALRDLQPDTYSSAPLAYALLADQLEKDHAFARNFFSRIRYMTYGGAPMPASTLDRYNSLAEKLIGERLRFFGGYGATETCGPAMMRYWPTDQGGELGAPLAGMAVKLVPINDRFELRLKGPNVFHNYWNSPDATARAFDEEGYYRTGDVVRLPDGRADQGLDYSGRLTSAFKLDSGTWVNADELRLVLVQALAPLVQDAVICGSGRRDVRALAWANRAASIDLFGAPPEELTAQQQALRDAWVEARISVLGKGLGSSMRIARMSFVSDPLDSTKGEINDKGHIVQPVCIETRAAAIEELYHDD